MSTDRDLIFEFIQSIATQKQLATPISDDTDLLESQILDSVNLVKLLIMIQQKWQIEVSFNDLSKENFKDLHAILETIERLKRPR